MQQQESLVAHQAPVIYQVFQAHAIRNFPRNRLIFSSSTFWEETSDFVSSAVWEVAGRLSQGSLSAQRWSCSWGLLSFGCLCAHWGSCSLAPALHHCGKEKGKGIQETPRLSSLAQTINIDVVVVVVLILVLFLVSFKVLDFCFCFSAECEFSVSS